MIRLRKMAVVCASLQLMVGTTFLAQTAFAGDFPAVIELSTLDGTNGFKIVGSALNDGVGGSVSSAGDFNADGIEDIAIGASGESPIGAAYIVYGHASPFSPRQLLDRLGAGNGTTIQGLAVSGGLASALVAKAGDVNGDGTSDLAITGGGTTAYVLYGGRSSGTESVELSRVDGKNGFRFVADELSSISGGGDINHDGFDDVLTSAFGFSRTYVIFGKHRTAFSLPTRKADLLKDTTSGAYSGISLAGGRDINRDGLSDIVIGAPAFLSPGRHSKASVVFGTATGDFPRGTLGHLDGSNGFEIVGSDAHPLLGVAVGMGDINGDGRADVLLSDDDQFSVILGSIAGFPAKVPVASLDGTNGFTLTPPLGQFTHRSAGAFVSDRGAIASADVNGDHLDDLILGVNAFNCSCGLPYGVYVVFGRTNGFPANIDLGSLDGTNGFFLGGEVKNLFPSVGSADVNGDGVADILVGVPGQARSGAGVVYVVFGRP